MKRLEELGVGPAHGYREGCLMRYHPSKRGWGTHVGGRRPAQPPPGSPATPRREAPGCAPHSATLACPAVKRVAGNVVERVTHKSLKVPVCWRRKSRVGEP